MLTNTIGRATLALVLIICVSQAVMAQQSQSPAERTQAPQAGAKFAPLMERYILDELKAVRTELAETRVQMIREITDRELKVAEVVSNVANNTVTFFFYLFAVLGTILAIWGWGSIKDLNSSVRTAAESEITRLSQEYETRLTKLEEELSSKGTIILENQRDIERTQSVHALWLQANQTSDARAKVEIYDRILELVPGDQETMAYKADAALELGDREWALSLCNRILEENPDNSHALYQRACAQSGLRNIDAAIMDLEKAVELTPGLGERARGEEEFAPLRGHEAFDNLLSSSTRSEPVNLET